MIFDVVGVCILITGNSSFMFLHEIVHNTLKIKNGPENISGSREYCVV